VRRDLPSGTVTFLFTDVEGSTKLLHELGPDAYGELLAEHRRIVREAFAPQSGVEVDTQGDAFFVAFPTAPGALRAASDVLAGLTSGPVRLRMGIHTGSPHLTDEGYVGVDVHRAARIAACGHGGQVLVSASTASLVGAQELRDLGEHRLKDLSAPERIYQLGDGEFPPLKSLHQTNLPVPATPFLGREQEVAEVAELLAREDVRLVTLTGAGGSGKTRLALQSAAAAADVFPAGVWWVPLAPLTDAALVMETAARALGATGDLVEHIGDKRLLLLFDNFEHVVVAAPEVAQLLERCPRLSLLVTSREPLRLEGEWEYAVDPLREHEAVALFETRARAARRDFVADGQVREICSRLDNLPLAIELAAARVKVLSPAALLERLERRLPVLAGGTRDAPERQRTLRATIEWSHDLLAPEEQTLFRRLGVFAGGATLETIETICDAELDTLASLVDKSLVRLRDGDRYWMLETIREFAVDQLDAAGDAEQFRRRHAEHFLALAEEAEPHLPAYRRDWIDRLEGEHDNLRTALDWFSTAHEPDPAFRLAGALYRFWMNRGYFLEARNRYEDLLASDAARSASRAKALAAAAMIADEDKARDRAHEALSIYRELGDAWGTAFSELALGSSYDEVDMATARDWWDKSARAFGELGEEQYVLIATRHLAWACINLGERDRGRKLHEENLLRARALGNERMEAVLLGALAIHMLEEGDLDDALRMLKESHELHHAVGDPFQSALDAFRFAAVLAYARQAEAAAQAFSSADAQCEEIGASLRTWDPAFIADVETRIRADLDEAAYARAWEQGRALSVDDAVAIALALLEP
jgi:predicted ATPase/class 3 adenylate cyclase